MTLEALNITLIILFWHFIADFLCQTDWMANNKSKGWDALLWHTAIYSVLWFFPVITYGIIYDAPQRIILFVPITFVAHTVTDYITSRETTKLWTDGKIRPFFHVIGLDQYLHYIQLFVTFYALTR